MSGAGRLLARARRLGPAQWRLLARATLTLARARGVLMFAPFARALSFGSVAVRPRKTGVEAADVVWAVRAAARRVPFRAMCIEQGIAAQRMLRLGGIDARLHYGARPEAVGGSLSAHVWVSVGGKVVIGGEEAAGFAEVAAFP